MINIDPLNIQNNDLALRECQIFVLNNTDDIINEIKRLQLVSNSNITTKGSMLYALGGTPKINKLMNLPGFESWKRKYIKK